MEWRDRGKRYGEVVHLPDKQVSHREDPKLPALLRGKKAGIICQVITGAITPEFS
jgi:hypothetical protein